MERVSIIWSATAKAELAKLSSEARKALLRGVGALRDADDLDAARNPLMAPLNGKFHVSIGRYKAIYTVEKDELPSGDILSRVNVVSVCASSRTPSQQRKMYLLAKTLFPFYDEEQPRQ